MGRLWKKKLKERLETEKGVVIYGTGYIAQCFYNVAVEADIDISYCIVTNKGQNYDFNGIPIYTLDEKIEELKESKRTIVITVSELYVEEIKSLLNCCGLNNCFWIEEYARNVFEIMNSRMQLAQNCLEEVAEWYIDENISSDVNKPEIVNNLRRIIRREKIKRKVAFVICLMSPRVVKIVEALQNNEYEIELIVCSKEWVEDVRYSEFFQRHESTICECMEELMYQLIMSRAELVHIFSEYDRVSMAIAYNIILRKDFLPVIVFEQYDIANGMYCNIAEEILREERYCLETADGICCRGNELDYLIQMKFNINGQRIKFWDYIGNEVYENKSAKELSMCYAGGLSTERDWPEATYACLLEFAKLCEKNKCHFHLYPTQWDENKYIDYIRMDKNSLYFHFHKPIAYRDVARELSQYDYGVVITREGFLEKENNGGFSSKKVIYSTTNKFYDYLAAGLPIVAAFPVLYVKYLEEKGVLINWTIEEFDFEQLRKKRQEMKERVKAVRKEWQIKFKIVELIAFYESLLK